MKAPSRTPSILSIHSEVELFEATSEASNSQFIKVQSVEEPNDQDDIGDQALGNTSGGGKRAFIKQKMRVFGKESWAMVKSQRFGQEALRTAIACLVFGTITSLMMVAQMESDRWFDRYSKNLVLSLSKMRSMAAFRTVFAVDPLHDRLFTIIPDWSHMRGFLPDAFLSSFLGAFFLFNVLWVHRKRIQFQGLVVLRRVLWIMSCLYLFRTMTFIVTTVPNPIHNCVPKYAAVEDFEAYLLLIKDMASGRVSACTDNIYSGHTAMVTVIFFSFWMYSGLWILKIYALIHGSLTIGAILITRLHYTVDVLIAMFMSAFVFLTFHFLLTIMLDDKLIGIVEVATDETDGYVKILRTERRALHRVYSNAINRAVWWIDGFDLRLASGTANPELLQDQMELIEVPDDDALSEALNSPTNVKPAISPTSQV